MYYAILCYNDEAAVGALTREQDDALMADLAVVGDQLTAEGRLGPVARLMPTTAATTLRAGAEPLVLDGPFVETKEQLGGFSIVDVSDLDAALVWAERLSEATTCAIEVRPLIAEPTT